MNALDCVAFERRLDAGDRVDDAMRAHAAQCARCAAALAAMAEIDALFAHAPAAPDGFTAAVMAHVTPRRTVTLADTLPADDMPWWLGILLQPATLLAAVLAAAVIWRGQSLVGAASLAAAWLSGTSRTWEAAAGALSPATTWTIVGLALGLAPAAGFLAFALSGWVSGWMTRRAAA